MPLSWNEIKTRAVAFTKEWKDKVSEDADAKSFWDVKVSSFNYKLFAVSNYLFHSRILFQRC